MRFVGEKLQNLPFMGRTRTLVLVPKVGTGTHSTEGNWYQYQKLGYRYLFTREGLVPVTNKGVPGYRYRCSQQPYFCVLCSIKSCVHTLIVKEP